MAEQKKQKGFSQSGPLVNQHKRMAMGEKVPQGKVTKEKK